MRIAGKGAHNNFVAGIAKMGCLSATPPFKSQSIWVALFLALMVTAGFGVIVVVSGSGFVLSRLINDPMLYFVMSKSLAQHSTVYAALVENMSPFSCAFGMAYIYAGVFKIFSIFESQVRGIQALNLFFIFCYMLLIFRYMSKTVSSISIPLIVGLFGFMLILDSHWQYFVVMPNADLVPAIITILTILIAQPVLQPEYQHSHTDVRTRTFAILLLGGLGFFVKISLLVLPLVFVCLLIIKNRRNLGFYLPIIVFSVVFGFSVIIALNSSVVLAYLNALMGNYVLAGGDISMMSLGSLLITSAINLICSALPDAILTRSRFLIYNPIAVPINNLYDLTLTASVTFSLFLGAILTFTAVVGACRLWPKCRFELVCLALCLPVFMLVTDSTDRYLASFKPVIFVCFLTGMPTRLPIFSANHRNVLLVISALVIIFFSFLQVRSLLVRNQGNTGVFVSAKGIDNTYRDVLNQLRYLSPENTRIIYFNEAPPNNSVMWGAVTGIPLYFPDAKLPNIVKKYRTLVVLSCTTLNCLSFEQSRRDALDAIHKVGEFNITLIYRFNSTEANAEIYRIEPAA